ncbi:protein translocase subunit SecF [Pseudoduganella buxea]|uniref:Protein-export membrane protein SecF n=1 Tax=Pseudoduganella buxea TaxID=1949069 RepID=A0A6I3SW78_9BURK|nr:protein translocase subunit SecF [Pseudoduganella buxea]MTV53528.1 protein translocase subunit SecF [Pseudoduganella buxea]GGC14771.1 protein-export membrane protein SecF [Pseudoduganella buxea]
MEFFRIQKDIPFMRHALVFNVVSVLTFVAAVFFLFDRGLHLSIEFKGGTVLEVKYPQAAELERMRQSLSAAGFEHPEVSTFGTASDVMIRLPIMPGSSSDTTSSRAFDALCRSDQGTPRHFEQVTAQGERIARTACVNAAGKELVSLQRVEFVGPQVGEELTQNGLNALVMVIVGVMIYLAVRFEWKFAVAAIIANLHDVIIIMGFFAYFQWEFSLTVLAAILAVLGYSVNESVVIFDRIRENFRKQRKMSVHEVIDNAITSTISRTIITHASTEMSVLAMLFLGGPALHYFALALAIGILFSIYSSVFVAAAIAMWLGVKREDLIKPVKEKDETDGAVV